MAEPVLNTGKLALESVLLAIIYGPLYDLINIYIRFRTIELYDKRHYEILE